MATSSTMTAEIKAGRPICAVEFSTNGEYLLSGDDEGVRLWQVEDGKQIVIMAVKHVLCLAVSKDGRWIAAGTESGELIMLDAETREKVSTYYKDDPSDFRLPITAVNFSPGSTRLVVASGIILATVQWDVATRTRAVLDSLRHKSWVRAAKYSPRGDRIATATEDGIRVYDSSNGCLLVDIPLTGARWLYNTGLLWSNDRLFVVSDGRIKQIESCSGSLVSEWPVPSSDHHPCIALAQCGEFIAYSAKRTVLFWRTSTLTQLGLIQHTQDIRSIAFSPNNRFLAIGGEDGKITVKNLRDVLPPSAFTVPFIDICDAALDSWKQDRLADTEASLTGTITSSTRHPKHHALANRALVRAHLRHWDVAIDDAENSIKIQPSVIGYIAKCVALICGGKKREGCRTYDFVFRHCGPIHVNLLLLIKAVILFMAGEHDDAVSRVGDLITTVPFSSMYCVVQAYMYLLLGNEHMESSDYQGAIQLYEHARAQMRHYFGPALCSISLISGWKFDDIGITIQQRLCEALYAVGRVEEGGESLLTMVNTFGKKVNMSKPLTKWVSDFTRRCLSARESDGDVACDEVRLSRTTLNSTTTMLLLREWARSTLVSGSWKVAMVAAVSFTVSRFTIYRAVCERLETIDRMTDASECCRQMVGELAEQTSMYDEQAGWALEKLEGFGDTAMSAEQHDNAIFQYSAALSLDPAAPQGLFIKRSKAYLARGLWEDALNDANKVIALNPSSPWGYERKHAALHKAGDYENAVNAFEVMLSKMSQSPDLATRERRRQFVNPGETKVTIRRAIQDAIRESPRVLINTTSGRLCDKSEQAAALELFPVFTELISSMTTHIDHFRIEHEVARYYHYAMLSHKWEDNEPLFDKVIHITVYDLEESPTHNKLQMLCKIARDAGFHWAWSDTCCINKADHFVLQEALVAMFKWYQGSAVTIVFLRGVGSQSRRGDLVKSIWNTRAWTFQEYHASKVVRFYTEDWTLYMNIDIPNHKESPEIISEMEEATGVSARALTALRPGLDDIREKLCLASRRETTLIEDAAYSLLGIFSASLPVVYGEGNKSLGRLLAQLLTSSGDTDILAWTGRSGSFNSCLPADITVFHDSPTSHIPPVIKSTEMEVIIAGLRASSLNLAMAMKLYDRLNELSVPLFVGQRMKLPCLIFKLGSLSPSRCRSEHVFRAQTTALGIVEIETREDLSRVDSLYLIHPWIDFLLDRRPVGSIPDMIPEETTNSQSSLVGEFPSFPDPSNITLAAPRTRAARFVARLALPLGGRSIITTPRDAASLRPPSSVSQTDKETRALQLMVRLRQPFGALLVTPTRQNIAEYRRVASESRIVVRVQEDASLNVLIDNARVLDVL